MCRNMCRNLVVPQLRHIFLAIAAQHISWGPDINNSLGGANRERRFGSPGGDGQDQWSLNLFLYMVHYGMEAQQVSHRPQTGT
jgi:hypothetical protein